jgi:hypothetical protein
MDVRAFYPPECAADVAVAAMNFLANTSAVIIDLRTNDGGAPTEEMPVTTTDGI